MASAYDKLERILTLEQEQGCRDRAVVGGLARFLSYWERQARAEEGLHTDCPSVEQVLEALSGYDSATLEARKAALVDLLAELGRRQVVPGASEASAPAERAQEPRPAAESHLAARAPATPPPSPAEPRPAQVRRPPRLERPREPEGAGLDAPLTELKGVGPVVARRLARLGLRQVRDLLYHLPRRYNDFTNLVSINRLELGQEVTIVGVVQAVKSARLRGNKSLVRVAISDGTGAVEARWFNQPYLAQHLTQGTEIALSGVVGEYLGRLVFTGAEWEPLQRELLHTARMVPVYPLTEGIKARWMRRLLRSVLDQWAPRIADPVPQDVLDRLDLIPLGTAIAQVHFPDDGQSLVRARRRLCFDELLLLQLGLLSYRGARRGQQGRALDIPRAAIDAMTARLPFALTGAQTRAIGEILADLAQPVPMSRLLQGDVGSGKTVVAAAAILATVLNGLQAAVMVPTSILAQQHYRTISGLLAGEPQVRCALLEGTLSEAEKDRVRAQIASGEVNVVIGTHALIQSSVEFASLGLVVLDEQHRFGVEQRAALREKGQGCMPHMLAMSATPIPRTLALTVYGDLDISTLDELPPNRQQVITAVRDKRSRERIYSFVRSQVQEGRQAFVVCPLVEESDALDAKAAEVEYGRLRDAIFPDLRVGLLHGKMSPDEKESAMAAFHAGEYDILVATAVIEVGIDVPNATVMLIEGAERFGLAQMHQFRGRVGRGENKSYCILLSDDPSDEGARRLQIMAETNDGFALAEEDLRMRGPGDFLGVRQHGLPTLKVAELSDADTLEKARAEAMRIYNEDPELKEPHHQALGESVRRFWSNREFS